jgi:hypothetical protein
MEIRRLNPSSDRSIFDNALSSAASADSISSSTGSPLPFVLSNQLWDFPNFLRGVQIVIDADREMAINTLRY